MSCNDELELELLELRAVDKRFFTLREQAADLPDRSTYPLLGFFPHVKTARRLLKLCHVGYPAPIVYG